MTAEVCVFGEGGSGSGHNLMAMKPEVWGRFRLLHSQSEVSTVPIVHKEVSPFPHTAALLSCPLLQKELES